MKYINDYGFYNKVRDKCSEFDITDYTITNDKLVDVHTDVYLNNRKLTSMPFNFGLIDGGFWCGNNLLTSLAGSPKEINGSFDCSNNKLTSLKFVTTNINGNDFNCSVNQLKSLKELNLKECNSFNCSNNVLDSLVGCPKYINTFLFCQYNKLESLEGISEDFRGQLFIRHNKIKTLKYFPENITEINGIEDNALPKLIVINKDYIYDILKLQDEYNIWNYNDTLNIQRYGLMIHEITVK